MCNSQTQYILLILSPKPIQDHPGNAQNGQKWPFWPFLTKTAKIAKNGHFWDPAGHGPDGTHT